MFRPAYHDPVDDFYKQEELQALDSLEEREQLLDESHDDLPEDAHIAAQGDKQYE